MRGSPVLWPMMRPPDAESGNPAPTTTPPPELPPENPATGEPTTETPPPTPPEGITRAEWEEFRAEVRDWIRESREAAPATSTEPAILETPAAGDPEPSDPPAATIEQEPATTAPGQPSDPARSGDPTGSSSREAAGDPPAAGTDPEPKGGGRQRRRMQRKGRRG